MPMATWTCPDCRREFGAVGRGHLCSPGLTVEQFLERSPAFVAPVFRAVHDHLVSIDDDGDLIVDPIEGKVLFKHGGTFCILDAKTRWVAVGFSLRRRLASARLSRKVADHGNKFFHVVNTADPAQVDGELCEWLTEAYHLDDATPSIDPMVPDDVDVFIEPA